MIQNVNNKFQNTTPPYSELKGFSKEVLQFVNHYNFNNNNEIKDSFQKHFTSKRLIVYADVAFDKYRAIDHISGYGDMHILQYATPLDAFSAFTKYNKNPNIKLVVPDIVIELEKTHSSDTSKLSLHRAEIQHSWGYERIKTEEAFEYILKGKTLNDLPDVVVGIIDDGVEMGNDDFSNRLVAAYSFTEEPENPFTSSIGHGARVCSVLMENTLPNVKFISYKIFSASETTLSILHLAEMQAELDGVDFINSSYGMFAKFNSGISKPLHIASVGNVRSEQPQYPAACNGVISVTAINQSEKLYKNAAFGDWVKVAAPGENLKLPSTYADGDYVEFTGTSCAAPFVTSICAMIKTQHPNLNNEQIKQVLYDSCEITDIPVRYGIVNMFNAVSYLDNVTQPEVAEQIVDFTLPKTEPALV
ncbi:MAG: S8/S53 family peptidase [Clostridia bacterium]|nr:S8/S53 family peptidase [Clostridia bacterium]